MVKEGFYVKWKHVLYFATFVFCTAGYMMYDSYTLTRKQRRLEEKINNLYNSIDTLPQRIYILGDSM